MTKRLTTMLAAVAATVALAGALPVHADKVVKPNPGPAGSWRLIGQTHADHSNDHDTIGDRVVVVRVIGVGLSDEPPRPRGARVGFTTLSAWTGKAPARATVAATAASTVVSLFVIVCPLFVRFMPA